MVYRGAHVEYLDANGDVSERLPVASGTVRPEWRQFGRVSLSNLEVFRIFGAYGFSGQDEVRSGLAVHLLELVAGGWGETPEEVVSWATPIAACRWLVEGQWYRVMDPGGVFGGAVQVKFRQQDGVAQWGVGGRWETMSHRAIVDAARFCRLEN
jgi:hypothetical protein|tara:strand:+ start:2803 stop:3264 length:462 start_codon:yes stop_codon:yes gene_type:complete